MNYREQQLRQVIKKDYVPKSQYEQETNELKKARSQELIDKLQKDLGINFLLDYQEIVNKLNGRTVEELLKVEQFLLKTNEALTLLAEKRKVDLTQEKQALIKLAKQKLANKKEASELLNSLEER